MTKQKKPKTGDVVGWHVIDCHGIFSYPMQSRDEARKYVSRVTKNNWVGQPFRVVRSILAH